MRSFIVGLLLLSPGVGIASAQITAPEINTPPVKVPQATTPQAINPPVKTPQVNTPPVKTPQVNTPPVPRPEGRVPEARVPEVRIPPKRVPEVKNPITTTPEVKTPITTTPEVTMPNPPETNTGGGNDGAGSTGDTGSTRNAARIDTSSNNASSRSPSEQGSASGGSSLLTQSPADPASPGRAALPERSRATRRQNQQKTRTASPERTGASSKQAGSSAPRDNVFRDVIDFIPLPIKLILTLLTLVALLLGVKSWLAGRDAKRLVAQREALLQDIGLLSSALLPDINPHFETLALAAAYRPANGPGAGGDFYDAFPLNDGRLGLLLGDVSGHGREALGYTALARHTLRAYMEAGMQPRAALQMGSSVLDRQLQEGFTTVISAIYDPTTCRLTYASAGHPRPVFVGQQAPLELAEYSSPPMGAGLPTGRRQTSIVLDSDAGVYFFTDGLFEAKTESGDWLGGERVEEIIQELPHGSGGEDLLLAITEEAQEIPDDMAALVVWQANVGGAESSECYEELEVETCAEAASFINLAPSAERQALREKVAITLDQYEVAVVRLICLDTKIEAAEIFPREPALFPVLQPADS